MAKLTVEIEAEKVEAAINQAYMKERGKISVPGFRKGKVPRAMIEKMYGTGVFLEEAVNILLSENYPAAVDQSGADVVSRPEIDIVQIESGKPFIFTAEVAVKPEVTLGKYAGVTVTKVDTTVTDEEVDAELTKELEKDVRVETVERASALGDAVVIDYEGSVDGVPFEGGKAEGYTLELGSGTFINGFEDQLVGKSAGDEVDVNVTFPEEYHAEDLAGKPALFKVKVHEVKAKEIPVADDDFAADKGFDTLAEYKEELKKNLEEKKENDAKAAKEDEAIQKIIDKSEMDIPEAMIINQSESMIEEFEQRIQMQGLSLEQYYQFSGLNKDKLMEQVRDEAITRIKSSLVLEAIAKAEGLEATDEDVDAEIEKMAAMYGMEADKLKEYIGDTEKSSIKKDIQISKAVAFIMDNAKERAKAKSKAKDDEAADEE